VTADEVYGQDPWLRGGPHWLLIRRRISDGEYAFCRAHAPGPVPLAQLVRVAGLRWKVEDGFAAGEELAALDEHQVRCWTSWHRWTILALLAHAFLSVLAATQRTVVRRGLDRGAVGGSRIIYRKSSFRIRDASIQKSLLPSTVSSPQGWAVDIRTESSPVPGSDNREHANEISTG
jgi:hypothetical protein